MPNLVTHSHRLSLACAALLFLAIPVAASAQIFLELLEVTKAPIPPDGSQWHELYPAFCTIRTQDAYEDNGDGVISPCDRFSLDGEGYHIEWVGPTYALVPCGAGGEPDFLEPVEPQTGGDPTCEIWREVWPDHGMEWHVDDWVDNGDGVLSVCDMVYIGGLCYHIENIGLNVNVRPDGPVDSDGETWGRIKSRF
jgi:hypothetical protein